MKSSLSAVAISTCLAFGSLVSGMPAMAEGHSPQIEDMPAPNLPAEQPRGWHVLGIEGALGYSDLPGTHFTTIVTDGFDTSWDVTSFEIGLNFANRDLTPDEARWIVSPFFLTALDGDRIPSITIRTTENHGAIFEWQEAGLRVEREQYIDDVWSWTMGASASYVDIKTKSTFPDTADSRYLLQEVEGSRLGVHVGANARLNPSVTFTSRIGYSFVEINESRECGGMDGTPCATNVGRDDDDSSLDGLDARIGLRYVF